MSRSGHPQPHRSPLHLVVPVCQRLQVGNHQLMTDLTVFKVSNDCSQAGDLYQHSHPFPCLPQKRRRRPSPVSTRIHLHTCVHCLIYHDVLGVLFVSLSSISCIHHHSSSAEKMSECPVQGSEPALVPVPSDGKEVHNLDRLRAI